MGVTLLRIVVLVNYLMKYTIGMTGIPPKSTCIYFTYSAFDQCSATFTILSPLNSFAILTKTEALSFT